MGMLLIAAGPSLARPGTVLLRNGQVLRGDLGWRDARTLAVSSDIGTITFHKSEVRFVKYYGKEPAVDRHFAAALAATPGRRDRVSRAYDPVLHWAASQERLDPALVKAVAHAESGMNPSAVSRKGAQGLMQLMPGTAHRLGVSNALEPSENARGGARYLRDMLDLFGGDVRLALAGYNAGPDAVRKYRGVPPYRETRGYIAAVLSHYRHYREARPPVFSFTDRAGVVHLTNEPDHPGYKAD